jgi:hypothetical protein
MYKAAMKELVDQRLDALRQQTVEELSDLPACTEEFIDIDGSKVQLFTIHDKKDDEHLYVVQATRSRWAGITAKVIAQGIKVSADRSVRLLSDEELYDFT